MAGPGHRETGFSADLHWLWQVGKYDLPSVAAAYAQANNGVADTGDVREAYQGSELFDGSATLAAWTALRDEVQGILATMATTLERVGEALWQSAATYAEVNHAVKDEMDRLNLQLPTESPQIPPVRDPRDPAGGAASDVRRAR